MFKIDRNKMDANSKLFNAKSIPGKNNKDSHNSFKSTIWNLIEKVGEFTIYEMSHWICNIDRWLSNRSYTHKYTYHRGDILSIDLGATNFKFEPSFTHPCIVLKNTKDSLLIVPCSSKKFGQGYHDIIDAHAKVDGFKHNTGIQINCFRWIHKNRVISKVGKTSPRILDEINSHMLKLIPTYKKEKAKFKAESEHNVILKDQLLNSEKEIETLKEEIFKLNKLIIINEQVEE